MSGCSSRCMGCGNAGEQNRSSSHAQGSVMDRMSIPAAFALVGLLSLVCALEFVAASALMSLLVLSSVLAVFGLSVIIWKIDRKTQ